MSDLNNSQNFLDIAYRVINSSSDIYVALARELIQITSADFCLLSLSANSITDFKTIYKSNISSEQIERYINSLQKKVNFQSKRDLNPAFSLRSFWKANDRYKQSFALVIGASQSVSMQLKQKPYYLAVSIESKSSIHSEGSLLEISTVESYVSITAKERDCLKFSGKINAQQICIPSFYQDVYLSSLMKDITLIAEYHLLPPDPISALSIPLGFTYSNNLKNNEFVTINLAWFGTEEAHAIDLDINLIDWVVQLCRFVSHEVVTKSIDREHLCYLLWDVDSLTRHAGLTKGERESLDLILQDYSFDELARHFGIKTIDQKLQKLRDKIKPLLNANPETRKRLEECKIDINSRFFSTNLVKKALMCSEYYRGNRLID
ncbi:hypothetical protein BST81_02430 [Leptolyngbya sp. 'hensonii']|uniref:helix-turn-helix transcriptional regulator n=1 Tax=Leptolyngbya sp. 'hensonii' TaxID=1922337 RepID=UPI0009501FD4|nr:hypothetical protein [Leptolyngbya sp. 'hensonii']OLP20112.1 hypothetical protein BST81_02430 [Leptolyngbya sp. 'hensonii']